MATTKNGNGKKAAPTPDDIAAMSGDERKQYDMDEFNKVLAGVAGSTAKSRTVEPDKRDDSRLYIQGIGGVPDGYYDELPDEEKAWVKVQYPGVIEGLDQGVKDLKNPPKAKKVSELALAPGEPAPRSVGYGALPDEARTDVIGAPTEEVVKEG